MRVSLPVDFDRQALNRLVREVDPAAFVVPERILRRVIRTIAAARGASARSVHLDALAIRADELLAVVDRDELGLSRTDPIAETVLLIAEPRPDDLESTQSGAIPLNLWRSLFHASLHRSFRARIFDDDEVRDWIRWLGELEFEEIRAVLSSDCRLAADERDDRAVLEEFAATCLELARFEPRLLRVTFPGLLAVEATAMRWSERLDAETIFLSTRIPGAIDPELWNAEREADRPPAAEAIAASVPSERREPLFHKLVQNAERAERRGNLVGGAIARVKAAAFAAPGKAGTARSAAREDLARLALRLKNALRLDPAETADFRDTLPDLLPGAIRGFWSVEARLLYDLQKVCLDHERPIHSLDFFAWFFSMGRRPLKRPLPLLGKQLKTRHLRLADRRLRSVRLTSEDRQRLSKLIDSAIVRSILEFQGDCRPPIHAALASVGFEARNAPERAALRKLVEELTDTITEQGLLSLGLLRDAIARGRLKMADLSGPVEFFLGDRLLKADRALARVLGGVYRPGEFYLRWLQRLSSLAFGTKIGRFLTLNLFLPFGAAFVGLEAIQHLIHMFVGKKHGPELGRFWLVAATGLFVLGLIRSLEFRRWVVSAARCVGAAIKKAAIDAPAWLANRPWVRAILDSPAARVFWRWAVEPALLSSPIWLLQPGTTSAGWFSRPAVFIAVDFALNSRAGRRFQEWVFDTVGRSWRWIGVDLIPGVFRLVLAFFQRVLETIDRVLYSVDQWLRFRAGESRLTVVSKILFGSVWFVIAYVVRFAVNLLIEPQLNPIKHFPVVTVSHKILLTQSKRIYDFFLRFGAKTAEAVTPPLLLFTPGVFGFFFWEFRENWRLYEANRDAELPQVMIGRHGETLPRLLRPGLHSGTLPKLYRKLRRAEAGGPARRPAVRRLKADFEHLEEALRRFVERDAIWLLEQSGVSALKGLHAGGAETATNFIRLEIRRPEAASEPLRITFEERADGLVVRAESAAWVDRLSIEDRAALANALAGLYRGAGVDGLWIGPESEASLLPPNGRPRMLIKSEAIAWDRWVDLWERRAGSIAIAPWVERVLPAPAPAAEAPKSDREKLECP